MNYKFWYHASLRRQKYNGIFEDSIVMTVVAFPSLWLISVLEQIGAEIELELLRRRKKEEE